MQVFTALDNARHAVKLAIYALKPIEVKVIHS